MTQLQNEPPPLTPGEIRIFAFDFAPKEWAICDGRELAISEYEALFNQIGHTFGGTEYTFNLPDLRGRVLLHPGAGYAFGLSGGESGHALSLKEMAVHKHMAIASSEKGNEATPKHNFWSRDKPYRTDQNTKLNESAIGTTGEGQPHDNMAPFLSLNYCISLYGFFLTELDDDLVGFMRVMPVRFPFPDWEFCEGGELAVSQYKDLHDVIGNAYGGDGSTTFKLPDLRGRAMLGQGKGEGLSRYKLGDTGGASEVRLTEDQLPAHTHDAIGKITANASEPSDKMVWANGVGDNQIPTYATDKGTGPVMNPGAISVAGEGGAHNNMMPYQTLHFLIAVDGTPPERV